MNFPLKEKFKTQPSVGKVMSLGMERGDPSEFPGTWANHQL